jgi:hypothetical protein
MQERPFPAQPLLAGAAYARPGRPCGVDTLLPAPPG